MKSVHKHLVVAGLLATIGLMASAQTTAPTAPTPTAPAATAPAGRPQMGPMGHRMDPAKMQAWIAKRQAALKEKLKITPAQESAWTTFTAAMQPPANMGQRPDRAAFEKLSTPERIDKMRAMRTEHMAAMDKRADATKTFYAALTPEQQKIFDANTMRRHHGGMHGPAKKG